MNDKATTPASPAKRGNAMTRINLSNFKPKPKSNARQIVAAVVRRLEDQEFNTQDIHSVLLGLNEDDAALLRKRYNSESVIRDTLRWMLKTGQIVVTTPEKQKFRSYKNSTTDRQRG
jgi:hypothetical protein